MPGTRLCDREQIHFISMIEIGDYEAARKILTENHHDKLLLPVGPLQVTALQLASWQGRIDLLDLLHAKGANVNAADKIGRCALYHAAQRGSTEVVRWLLERGAFVETKVGVSSCAVHNTYTGTTTAECIIGKSLPLPECWGRTSLHQAVRNNHAEVVRILIDAGANVNVEDERGVTPILLAGSHICPEDHDEMTRFETIISVLVSAKASVNVIRSDTGSAVLHHATTLGSAQALKDLLEAGADPLLQCASTGSTPLHIAASSGKVEPLLALLASICCDDIDTKDKVGRTPLHRAAYQGHRECVRLLIDRGASLAAVTKTGVTVIDAIFAHIPRPLSFLTDILDSRVRTASNSTFGTEPYIIVDFSILTPRNELQMSVVTAIIEATANIEQLTVIQHPLLETFLRLKWSKLRICFFLLVLVHICFVLSLSLYSIILVHHVMDSRMPQRILTFCSCIILGHIIVEVVMVPRHYLKQLETWLSFTSASISLLVSAAGHYIREINSRNRDAALKGVPHRSQWVLHSISVAILLGWMQMMLLVGRFPTWGYYALMFSTVLKNILKVLLAFVCLIVGFALSFAVLFHGNDQFRDSWRAIVKTVVMMMGEYEYGDLFSAERDEGTFLRATSRIIFVAFVLLASIVLMNLMIGLAVNDIQGLEKEGHIRRLLKQAEFVAHLERVISHRIFQSNWLHPRLKAFVNSRRSIPTKIMLGTRENGRRELHRSVPSELMESLLALASKNFSPESRANKNEENDIVLMILNMEEQLRQMRMMCSKNFSERKFPTTFVRRKAICRKRNIRV